MYRCTMQIFSCSTAVREGHHEFWVGVAARLMKTSLGTLERLSAALRSSSLIPRPQEEAGGLTIQIALSRFWEGTGGQPLTQARQRPDLRPLEPGADASSGNSLRTRACQWKAS